MRHSIYHSYFSLLALTILLSACGRDADIKETSKQGVTAPPAKEEVVIEIPFEEHLNVLEAHPEKCAAPQSAGLNKVNEALKALYVSELGAAKELSTALALEARLSPFFTRVRAIADNCRLTKLRTSTSQEAVAAVFLKEASCENLDTEGALAAHTLFKGRVGPVTRSALERLLTTCGKTNRAENERTFRISKIGIFHRGLNSASASPCSADSRFYAEESAKILEGEYQAIAKPLPGSRLLALQLHLDLSTRIKKIEAACDPKNYVDPALKIDSLEGELREFEGKTSCERDSSIGNVRSKSAEGEASDLAQLLSTKYKKIVKDRYQALLAKASLLEAGCQEKKAANLRAAKVHELKARWMQFVSIESNTEARLQESVKFQIEISEARELDLRQEFSQEGRIQVEKLYHELTHLVSKWQQACRQSIANEKRRIEEERKSLEEEKRRQDEQKRIEEEKKKEDERKRVEEEKKKEEERKRAEEEKKKKEERKRAEEEKKKEDERKRVEEEKRKENERLRQEEIKRKRDEERKRVEEEKRKIEQERQRKDDERRRAEKEKYRSIEEKRQRLTPPKWEQERKPDHKVWTAVVLSVVRERMDDFDKARDADIFCPGYHKAELHERENCWLSLISAIAYKESSYRADTSFGENNGVDSIGFLALSVGECDRWGARTVRDFHDPVKNLRCGTNILASRIAKDGVVSDTDIGPDLVERRKGRGAAAYWSTLKPPHRVYHKRLGRWLKVGFKPLFVNWLKDYKKPRQK